MRRRHIEVTAHSQATPDALFALLAEGATWPRWSPIEAFELERAGDPPPEGVGAIRVFRRGRTTGRDQIVEVVPGRRLGYVSLSGLPVRDYRAHVELEPAGDGTTIRWQASFAPKVPGTGWVVERGLGRFLDQCAEGLAKHAAQ
jgi:Polyketide cyclase / dehydrase and lipid transport